MLYLEGEDTLEIFLKGVSCGLWIFFKESVVGA